tara:strand:- start:445 stop:588 length:144 start_codon:yes stop_codon:yes gene_type:complete
MSKKPTKKQIKLFKQLVNFTKGLEKAGIIEDDDPEASKELDKWLETL